VGSFHSDIKFVSPPTRLLNPSTSGTDITLSGDLTVGDDGIFSGGVSVGNTDSPLTGQIKLAASGGAGYLSFYDGSYREGHIDASTLYLDVSGAAKGTASATVFSYVNITTPGTVTAAAGTVSGALGVAGALSTSGTVSAAAGTVSGALGVGGTATVANVNIVGATGLVKQAAGVGSVATLVNADVSASAAISPTKLQPHEFLAYFTSSTSNDKTGDGTAYTVAFTAEVFDASSAHSSGVFTAPETGLYQFNVAVNTANVGAAHTAGVVELVASNRTVRIDTYNTYAVGGSGSIFSGSVLVDMDANDTVSVRLTVFGSTKTIGVQGNGASDLRSHFSGYLAA